MALQTSSNPLIFDGTGSKTGTLYIRQISWVDDNQDVADGSSCVITLNGVTVTLTAQMGAPPDLGNAVIWNAGPFSPPVKIVDFTVTTLSHGAVHVWLL